MNVAYTASRPATGSMPKRTLNFGGTQNGLSTIYTERGPLWSESTQTRMSFVNSGKLLQRGLFLQRLRSNYSWRRLPCLNFCRNSELKVRRVHSPPFRRCPAFTIRPLAEFFPGPMISFRMCLFKMEPGQDIITQSINNAVNRVLNAGNAAELKAEGEDADPPGQRQE